MAKSVDPIINSTQKTPESVESQSQKRLDSKGNFEASDAAQKAAEKERGLSRKDAFSINQTQAAIEEGRMSENILPSTNKEAGSTIGTSSVDSKYWQTSLDFSDVE